MFNTVVAIIFMVVSCSCALAAPPPVTAAAYSPDGHRIAVGGFTTVTVLDAATGHPLQRLSGHAGRINALAFSPRGDILAAAGGHPGRSGEIRLWDAQGGKPLATLVAHTDSIYGIAFSPRGDLLAAASYDHLVSIWRIGGVRPGLVPVMLKDHTDAVYAVAFSPDGARVASASGDRTVKVWDVNTHRRLFSLSESTAELYAVAWRPDGRQIAAAGVDRSIRTWDVRADGGTLAHASIAHDAPVLRLAYNSAGSALFSTGQDAAVKRWDAESLEAQASLPVQMGWPQALAVSPDDRHLAVGRQDGSLTVYDVQSGDATWRHQTVQRASKSGGTMMLVRLDERKDSPVADPVLARAPGNESVERAQPVPVPAEVRGILARDQGGSGTVSHFYRFHAARGERIILEVMAHRSGSPLDSELAIFDTAGRPVERAILRATDRTELTLFDKDSVTPAFRILTSATLHLKDLLLIGREVVEVVALPKGPDDDTQFRSFRGRRIGLFGTTPEYHTVGAAIFKVESFPPGAKLAPNGMPLTRLYYSNDDGGPLFGQDSFLDFTSPADGDYIVRLRDTRGASGPKFAYTLQIHPPRPDFKILFNPAAPAVPKDGAVVVNVEAERYEGFDGAIDVQLDDLPAGFSASATTIEPGQTSAEIQITAADGAMTPAAGKSASYRVVATAGGLRHTIEPDAKSRRISLTGGSKVTITTDLRELVIHPGHEASVDAAIVRATEFTARVPLDVHNLPFGVRVMDIGLNGVLIPENETARKFTIHVEPWVKPETRLIYVTAGVEGGIGTAAQPIVLRIE